MRKLLLILIVGMLHANVEWIVSYEEAKQAKKPIFVYIAQYGCPACAYMDKTLEDQKIYNYLNKHFVSYKQYLHKDNQLPSHLHASKTPTLHFLGSDGKKLIDSYSGGKGVESFYDLLQDAKAAVK